MSVDPSALLLGAAAVITAIGTIYVNRNSRRDQHRQAAAAAQVQRDQHQLEETKQALEALGSALTETRTDLHEERRLRRQAEAELEEKKTLHRHMYAAQESRCLEYAGQLTDTVLTLRGVVVDEIARAAADSALRALPSHPHDLPPATPPALEGEKDDPADR